MNNIKKLICMALIGCLLVLIFPMPAFSSMPKSINIDQNIKQSNDEANSNNGIAVQKNGWIYYSNIDDSDKLYKIKTDGSQKTKLNNFPSYSIDIEGDWLYYLSGDNEGNYIYRMKMDGSDISKIRECNGRFQVINGWIYFHDSVKFNDNQPGIYRISVDGQREELIYKGNEINGKRFAASDFCIYNEYIYFMSYQSNYGVNLNKIKVDGTSFAILKKIGEPDDLGLINNICCDGNNIFYSNFKTEIHSIDVNGENERIINNNLSDSLVLCNGWLYYSNRNDSGRLYRIKTDGSSKERLSDSQALNIVVLDNWVYFSKWLLDGPVYRERISDPTIGVFINGIELNMDQPPIMENNRVMVPIRAIFEALGYSVEWFQDTQIAVARKGQNTITVRINDPVISYNQGDYTCDVPPKILNGRILVPIRAIAECAGCSVEWQQDTKTVQINASNTEEDVVYTTKIVDIQANTLEKWIEEIDQAEQNVRGISPIGINSDGSYRDFGNIVTDREVLEYKQITVKLPYKQGVGLEDEYITGTMEVPSKVQYTLHKHKTKNEMNASFIGAFIAGLVNQQLVWTQTCSCGYQNKLTWDIPLENFKSLTGGEVYITTETTRLIN